jgi:hypothetical protein
MKKPKPHKPKPHKPKHDKSVFASDMPIEEVIRRILRVKPEEIKVKKK